MITYMCFILFVIPFLALIGLAAVVSTNESDAREAEARARYAEAMCKCRCNDEEES